MPTVIVLEMILTLTELMVLGHPDKLRENVKTLFSPWLFRICEVRAVGVQAVFCRHRVLPSQYHNKHELGTHFVNVARGQELKVISITPFSFSISEVILSGHIFGERADKTSPPNLLSTLLALRDNIIRTNMAKINMSKPMLLSDFLFCFIFNI